MLAMLGCGAPAQMQDEATITYRLAFMAGAADNTRVIFPLPNDDGGALMGIQSGLQPSDGGTISWIEQTEGLGAALDARGSAEAEYFVKSLKGVGGGMGPPDVTLSMQQPDGGPGDLYLRVNKSGSATVNVSFEFTASRDCGSGCGGKRSWTFSGPVGIALQPVHMNYVEEKR
jgi:hypothetical protein